MNQRITRGIAVLLLAACEPGVGSNDAQTVVRDSAGVRIVEIHRPDWSQAAPVGSGLPRPPFGGGAGDGLPPLHRVTDLAVTESGRIAVANAGQYEVRVHAPDGSLLWRVGSEGDGPGEFRGDLTLSALPGDTLVVFDWLLRRTTRIGPDGRVAGVQALPHWLPNTELAGSLSDGSLVISSRHLRLSPGLNQDSVSLHVAGSGRGEELEALASIRRAPVVLVTNGGPPMVDEQPLGPVTTTAVAGDRIYVAHGDRPEVAILRPDGAMEGIIRWNLPETPISPDLRRQWEAWDLDRRPPGERETRRLWLTAAPSPERLPATRAIVVSEDLRELWVGRFPLPWDEEARWDVFGADGEWLRTASLPASLTLFAVTPTLLAGVDRDELDVERVDVRSR